MALLHKRDKGPRNIVGSLDKTQQKKGKAVFIQAFHKGIFIQRFYPYPKENSSTKGKRNRWNVLEAK